MTESDLQRSQVDCDCTGFDRVTIQVKSLKKKLEELTKDNSDLLCAVKYLKSKMEQKPDSALSSRCATPTLEVSASRSSAASLGREVRPLALQAAADHDARSLRDQCSALERENARLRQRALTEGSFQRTSLLKLAQNTPRNQLL